MEKKLDKNPNYAENYCSKFEEYVNKVYVKKITENETTVSSLTFCLPHLGVINPNKPEKLRIVFDAAAKTTSGQSLNDYLLPRPDLYNSLLTILINFRIHKCFNKFRSVRKIDLHNEYSLDV